MDDFEETKPEFQGEEEVDALWILEDVRSYIYDMAKWTKFLSVVGFVLSAMMALFAFVGTQAYVDMMAAASPGNPILKIGAGGFTIIYLLVALLQFYPSFLLFKFSNAAMQAVLFADQASLSIAMAKLKSFFKFWGVLTMVFIGFYVFVILGAVIMSAGAGIK